MRIQPTSEMAHHIPQMTSVKDSGCPHAGAPLKPVCFIVRCLCQTLQVCVVPVIVVVVVMFFVFVFS